MQTFLISLLIKNMEITTTIRCHLALVRLAIVQRIKIARAIEEVKKREQLSTPGRNTN